MNDLLLPMLATSAAPFDADDYLFEIKWDGVRALAAVTENHWRLWGRQRADYSGRYPELDCLRRLPAGTVVDGELVVLRHGLPDLHTLLRRHHLVRPERIRQACPLLPVQYVLFDLLSWHGRSLLHETLTRRRTVLENLLTGLAEPGLLFSEGVIGSGRECFTRVVSQGHEGIMAKQRDSRYWPGKRSAAWRKIKPVRVVPCVIIGYTASRQGLRSLLVAAVCQGALRYVAELTKGFGGRLPVEFVCQLQSRQRSQPVVPCPRSAVWVEPERYCQVQFLRWTPHGRLRDAVFRGLLDRA